ncbi:MAG: patatin-like phospholipase family protein [Vicingaceae bacterium]|nr:patatin-like phospholipase family protein [Vicingaceae bacterium]
MDINNINYLTFEGGGGKGTIYLGAVQGLEEVFKPILMREALKFEEESPTNPTPPNSVNLNEFKIEDATPLINLTIPPQSRQLKGISGASAGAITAYMLAMGMNSIDIENETKKSTPFQFNTIGKHPITSFENFFDNPSDTHKEIIDNSRSFEYRNISKLLIGSIKSIYNNSALEKLFTAYKLYKKTKKSFTKNRIEGMLKTQTLDDGLEKTRQYAYNLLFTRGLFTGESVRDYIEKLMQVHLLNKIDEINNNSNFNLKKIEKEPKDITFKDFYYMTGVDLIFTGINISRHRPMYFSVHHTPDFPVTEAVGISMNIPIIFKPIWINYDVREGDKQQKIKYQGLWGDGGLLNNFPIHAFDNIVNQEINYQNVISAQPIASEVMEERKFCDCVLGLRLTDIQERENLEKPLKKENVFPENSSFIIGDYLNNLYETIMYPAENGQIRSTVEELSTININIRDTSKEIRKYYEEGLTVEMTDFSTPSMDRERGNNIIADSKERLIKEAREKVIEKFSN